MYILFYNCQMVELFSTENDAKKYLINILLKDGKVDYVINYYDHLYKLNSEKLNAYNKLNNLIKENKYDEALVVFKEDLYFKFSYSIKEATPVSKVSIRRPKGMQKYLDKQNKLAIFK